MRNACLKVVRRKDATNQLEELSVLWVFQDLRLFLPNSVANYVRRVHAPICKMSRLHAASFPANLSVRCRKPGTKYIAWKSRAFLGVG
jgi:hypothetical protein